MNNPNEADSQQLGLSGSNEQSTTSESSRGSGAQGESRAQVSDSSEYEMDAVSTVVSSSRLSRTYWEIVDPQELIETEEEDSNTSGVMTSARSDASSEMNPISFSSSMADLSLKFCRAVSEILCLNEAFEKDSFRVTIKEFEPETGSGPQKTFYLLPSEDKGKNRNKSITIGVPAHETDNITARAASRENRIISEYCEFLKQTFSPSLQHTTFRKDFECGWKCAVGDLTPLHQIYNVTEEPLVIAFETFTGPSATLQNQKAKEIKFTTSRERLDYFIEGFLCGARERYSSAEIWIFTQGKWMCVKFGLPRGVPVAVSSAVGCRQKLIKKSPRGAKESSDKEKTDSGSTAKAEKKAKVEEPMGDEDDKTTSDGPAAQEQSGRRRESNSGPRMNDDSDSEPSDREWERRYQLPENDSMSYSSMFNLGVAAVGVAWKVSNVVSKSLDDFSESLHEKVVLNHLNQPSLSLKQFYIPQMSQGYCASNFSNFYEVP